MIRDMMMMAGIGLGVLFGATQATAEGTGNCALRQHVIDRLASAYGETRQSIGLGVNNQVVEVFASTETGTWTITVTAPNGLMCLVASGQAYEAVVETLGATGDDA